MDQRITVGANGSEVSGVRSYWHIFHHFSGGQFGSPAFDAIDVARWTRPLCAFAASVQEITQVDPVDQRWSAVVNFWKTLTNPIADSVLMNPQRSCNFVDRKVPMYFDESRVGALTPCLSHALSPRSFYFRRAGKCVCGGPVLKIFVTIEDTSSRLDEPGPGTCNTIPFECAWRDSQKVGRFGLSEEKRCVHCLTLSYKQGAANSALSGLNVDVSRSVSQPTTADKGRKPTMLGVFGLAECSE